MAGLEAIAAQPDQKHKIEQYKVVLQQIVGSGSVKECKGFADHSKSLDHEIVTAVVKLILGLHEYKANVLLQFSRTMCH